MNYKLKKAFKKGKKTIIVSILLWILIAILFIMPWTCGCYQMKLLGGFNMNEFLRVYMKTTTSPSIGFNAIFSNNLFGYYLKNLFGFTLFYTIVVAFGLIRLMPKHQYDDIEHGSSDWSQRGEQYRILSNKKGIILGEDNYLPVDKRGNVLSLIHI